MQFRFTRIALAALLIAAGAAQAQRIQPPPLPPGSDRARPQAGLNEEERKRYVRAHHHKGHVKKDMTKDDSAPENKEKNENAGSGNSNAGGNNKSNSPKK